MRMTFHLRERPAAVPYVKYIAALLLFGSNGIVASRIHLESSEIILLRTLLGSMLLAAVAAAGKHACPGTRSRADFIYVVLSGISMGVSWMFQYEAYKLVGISITSLLYCLGPILIVILAQLFLGERMTLIRTLCLLAVSAGAVLTGGVSLGHGADAKGIACALLCAIAYAGMILFSKKNRSNRKDWIAIICTKPELSEEEIIRIYGKRWKIEVFFKTCKSYLKLLTECHSISFDALTAHVAIVFTRYMMLALEQRRNTDARTIGGLFLEFVDELKDIKFSESLQIIMNAFLGLLKISVDKVQVNIVR